jgi:hypothetical protein
MYVSFNTAAVSMYKTDLEIYTITGSTSKQYSYIKWYFLLPIINFYWHFQKQDVYVKK